jgi:prepilin-type N-terminal cleavage/methylation domain-containing protein
MRARPASASAAGGFTLVEVLISLVIGAALVSTLFQLWSANQRQSLRLGNKGDFRDRATLATTALNKSITMAGFGMSKLDVIARAHAEATDTLILFTNSSERRTTLMDTAALGATSIRIFSDTGFAAGGMFGITDSLQQEFATIVSVSGDSSQGFLLTLSAPLAHRYNPGVPDIYPAQKEKFFIDGASHSLIHRVDGANIVLAQGINDFRVDLKDGSGNQATSYKAIRVVAFTMTGTYKAPEGTFNQMRFSSTVIPRNIL